MKLQNHAYPRRFAVLGAVFVAALFGSVLLGRFSVTPKELFRLLQPYGVQQFVRSGIVAIIKSRRELLNEYLEELERSRRQTNSNHF